MLKYVAIVGILERWLMSNIIMMKKFDGITCFQVLKHRRDSNLPYGTRTRTLHNSDYIRRAEVALCFF